MWKTVVGWLSGGWTWFLGSPAAQIGAGLIALMFAWETTKARLKAEGAKTQKQINDAAAATERAEMVEAKAEVTDELRERVTHAEAAVARQPHLRSTTELRAQNPELAALILGADHSDGQ